MLFNKEKYFIGKTVLMLTHDFEPIIDIIYNDLPKWMNKRAYFLENKKCILIEKEIIMEYIKSFLDITNENVNWLNYISVLIYLRRLYELNNYKSEWYKILANLFHKREKIINLDESDVLEDEINKWIEQINNYIKDFDYNKYLKIVLDDNLMIELYKKNDNNYEKIQLYRVINEWKDHESKVVLYKKI